MYQRTPGRAFIGTQQGALKGALNTEPTSPAVQLPTAPQARIAALKVTTSRSTPSLAMPPDVFESWHGGQEDHKGESMETDTYTCMYR